MALEQKKQPGREAYEWVQILVCSVLAVVLVFTFAVRGFRVDGPSMRETLQDGDMLLVLNDGLCGDYQPGDIVILRKASFRDGKPIVKWVIATEGRRWISTLRQVSSMWTERLWRRTTPGNPPGRPRVWTFPLPSLRDTSLCWEITATTAVTAAILTWERWIRAISSAGRWYWLFQGKRRNRTGGNGAGSVY